MALFDSIFYGGGEFYGPTNTDVPQDLRFYRTNVDGVYVFHWGFLPAFITPLLTTYDFELQVATEDTFTAPIVDVLSADVIHYQNGDVRKGYEIEVPARLDKQDQTLYARVRTKNGVAFSDWSYALQFRIPTKWQVEEAENIVIAIPDYHVFGKEDLRKLVADRVTNLYTVADTYGKELDQTLLENLLTTTNNYISLCRDEALYDNFGVLFNYPKPQTQEFVEYRECLRIFILSALIGGTVQSLNATVRSFTGVNPNLELVRNRNDFFLSTIQENVVYLPNGGFETWSTGTSFVNPISGTFTADYWEVNNNGNTAFFTISREGVITDGSPYSLKWNLTATNATTIFGIRQILDYTSFAGKTITLKARVRVDSGGGGFVSAQITDSVSSSALASSTLTSGTWETLTITKVIDPSAINLQLKIGFNNVPGTAYLDNFEIYVGATPPPFFALSQNYINNSLVVLQNGTVLTNGVDFTENHATPGFTLTLPYPPGDILQTFYEIGLATDPEPLVFDPMDTTAITGTATFTHNSFNILGIGTLFSSQLISGNTITDATGLVLGVVDVVTDNTHLSLTQKWLGTTNTGAIKKLVYGEDDVPPSIMWDQKTLAYGVVIHVLNPGEFVLDQTLIQQVIDPFIPAHVKRFWEFD